MNTHLDRGEQSPRPAFSPISLVILVFVALTAVGVGSCKTETPQIEKTGFETPAKSAEKISCPPFPLEPHEPPITITNGSLKLDMEQMLVERIVGGTRPFNYSMGPEKYTDIKRVQVITETKVGLFDSTMYIPRQRTKLQLWLQKRLPDDQGGGWSPITVDPQIVFAFLDSGANPGLLIESERKLEGPTDSDKPGRKYRYHYKEFPPNEAKYFRLAKWSLNNLSTGAVINGPDGLPCEGQLNLTTTVAFQIVPFFTHD